jgi:hypothetical protein
MRRKPLNALALLFGLIPLFCSSLAVAAAASTISITAPDSDPDWTESYAQAQKILGTKPTAFLARVALGFAPGTKWEVMIKWAVAGNSASIRYTDSAEETPWEMRLSNTSMHYIERRLQDPILIKEIRNLPSRSELTPDSDYWILFVQMGKDQVILRSCHPDAIAYISKAKHIDEQQAAKQLGPDYGPMIECWSKIDGAFEPVLHPIE